MIALSRFPSRTVDFFLGKCYVNVPLPPAFDNTIVKCSIIFELLLLLLFLSYNSVNKPHWTILFFLFELAHVDTFTFHDDRRFR